jgi:hypothetical protein
LFDAKSGASIAPYRENANNLNYRDATPAAAAAVATAAA